MNPSIIGRYELKEVIGRGGMATVFRGYDPRFRREVAVKVMTLDFMGDETLRARFDREAQTIAALEHPAIVPVYDFGEEQNRPYLVMRLMSGGTLSDKLKNGALPLEEAVTILRRIGSALERAHQKGIIHRDLKPSNIMFDEYGDAYLADFGIARLTESAVTLTGESVVGTPAYMSPEQVNGDKALDGRSDIYALGIICFEMLTGIRPFQGDTAARIMMKHLLEPVPDIRQVKPDLPPGTEAIIARTLAKNPEDRFARAGELSDTLSRLTQGELPMTPAHLTKPASPAPVTPQPLTPTLPTLEAEPTEIVQPVPETEVMIPTFAQPVKKGEEASDRGRRTTHFTLAGLGGLAVLVIGVVLIISQLVRAQNFNENVRIPAELEEVGETAPAANETEAEADTISEDENETIPDNPDEAMELFYQSVDTREYGVALLAVNRAIVLDDQPWYHHERAFLYLLMGDTDTALAEINDVITQEGDDPDHFVLRGMIYRVQGELGKALLDHRRAVLMNPTDAHVRYELGLTYQAMDRLDEAINQWLTALDIGVEDASLYDALGHAYLLQERPDEAVAIYTRGLEQFPEEYGLYNARASVFISHLEDANAALADLNRSLDLNEEQAEAYGELGQLYLHLADDLEQALDYFNQAISHNDQLPWLFYDRALCHKEMEHYEAALEDLTQVTALDPANLWAFIDQGWIYLDNLNQPEQALVMFNQALAINADEPGVHLGRGRALLATQNDMDSALESFSTCIALDPEAYWCYWEMGWVYDTLEQPEEASHNFQLFVDKAPTNDCFECQVEAQAYIDEHH